MEKMRDLQKSVQLFALSVFVLLLLAFPAEAKPLAIDRYTPYQSNSVALPAEDQVDTYFNVRAEIAEKYSGMLVRVAKGGEEVYYYYPSEKKSVSGTVYLRFGVGNHEVEVNLVKPTKDQSVIEFDRLARMEIQNTGKGEQKYLLPSWGIESDSPYIIRQAQAITTGMKDDYAKVRAIHDWVAKNVQYDMDKYNEKRFYDNEGAVKALKTRKGLCRDYSNLVTAMCRAIGIESRTVIGQAGFGSSKYGHAWNEVRVDGKWINMDVTWAAGVVRNNTFAARYNGKYFDMKAEEFNKTHEKIQELY